MLYFLCIESLIIVGVFIYQVINQKYQYDQLKEVSTLNINSILFKEMFYDMMSNYTSLCFRSDNLEHAEILMPDDVLIDKIFISSQKLQSYLSFITKYVNEIQSFENGHILFDLFYDPITMNILRKDWKIDRIQSSLETQIDLYLFHMRMASQREFTVCQVQEHFFNISFIEKENIYNNASIDETFLFDYIINGVPTISKHLDRFIVEATKLQRDANQI